MKVVIFMVLLLASFASHCGREEYLSASQDLSASDDSTGILGVCTITYLSGQLPPPGKPRNDALPCKGAVITVRKGNEASILDTASSDERGVFRLYLPAGHYEISATYETAPPVDIVGEVYKGKFTPIAIQFIVPTP
jgi:hypothetical protein